MAVWHIKAGGTRVVGSGASTANDWTDANCFDDNSNLNEWWRILRDHAVDGDEIIFYDEDDGSTVITHSVETGNLLSSVNVGTVTIKSRSGDYNQCVLKCLTDTVLLQCKPNAVTINYVFEGIKFAEPSVGMTYNGAVYIQAEQLCGDVTFNNCSIGNCTLDSPTLEQNQGVVYSSAASRTITYNNSRIENITASSAWKGGSWIGLMNAGSTVSFTGTCYIENIACTVDASSVGIRGGNYGAGNLSVTGDIYVSNINNTVVAVGQINRALFSMSGTTTITGSITAENLTSTGGISGCALVAAYNTFDINNITADNVTITPGTGENSVGAVVLGLGAAAQGFTRNVAVKNVTCFSGAAVYYSDGAGGVAESIKAVNCYSGEHGAVYSGGYGDAVFRGIYCESCTSGDTGPAIFAHNHPVSSTRNKTVDIENVTIVNCEGNLDNASVLGDGHGIHLNNSNTTYTMTSTIKNAIVRNDSGTDEILLTEQANDFNLVTIETCDIEGGATGIKESDLNTPATKSNIKDDSTQISSVTSKLIKGATYKTAGLYVRYGSRDAEGRLFGLPVPIGGFSVAGNIPNQRNARN